MVTHMMADESRMRRMRIREQLDHMISPQLIMAQAQAMLAQAGPLGAPEQQADHIISPQLIMAQAQAMLAQAQSMQSILQRF